MAPATAVRRPVVKVRPPWMFGEFDEEAYLSANPDVRGLIERGVFRSALDHWHLVGANEHALGDRASGFFEHDLVYDEAAYLRHNPDVADAVRSRAVRSGYQHWIRFGRQEVARGVRWGPFSAKKGRPRPFKMGFVDGTVLLVAPVSTDFVPAARAEIRVSGEAPSAVGADEIVCSEPVVLVDACGAEIAVRFLFCEAPRGLVFRPLTRVTLSVEGSDGSALSAVYKDGGVQAFFFATADGANGFLLAARKSLREPSPATRAALTGMVLERLRAGPRTPGYEKPIELALEAVVPAGAGAWLVSGWLAVLPHELERCRAWCPTAGEFVSIHENWSRSPRADVLARFPEELGSAGDDSFGFRALVRFARIDARWEAPVLLFGFAKRGGPERWIEVSASSG